MDINGINAASVSNEPQNLQVVDVNVAERKAVANAGRNVKPRTVSMSVEETRNVAESLGEYMNILQTSIAFSINESSDQVVVTVTNRETDEIIRQIPPEELLELREKMKELTGIIFSETA